MDLELLGDLEAIEKINTTNLCLHNAECTKIEVCLYVLFKYNTWFEFGITQPLETKAIKVTC